MFSAYCVGADMDEEVACSARLQLDVQLQVEIRFSGRVYDCY